MSTGGIDLFRRTGPLKTNEPPHSGWKEPLQRQPGQAALMRVITIDGPAGSGKSSAARELARQLGWAYVTTGAIYRTLALMFVESGKSYTNEEHAEGFVSFLTERYRQDSRSGSVWLGDRDVSTEIRRPDISEMASIVAQNATIRQKLLPVQRKVVLACNGAVVDGRDMGTVVFPQAPLKVFLSASAEERARRRADENKARGEPIDLEALVREIHERDERDASRDCAPMKPADDAVLIDSTVLNLDQVLSQIIALCAQRGLIPVSHPT
jgi:cytidylate kinase